MPTVTVDLDVAGLVPLLLLAVLIARRRILTRDAGFEMAVRVRRGGAAARGWAFGVARYDGELLEWFRTFSAWPGPSRRFRRDALQVLRSREPTPAERAAVPAGHVVVECLVDDDEVDLSMAGSALTGLLAWMEAAPPGRGLVG